MKNIYQQEVHCDLNAFTPDERTEHLNRSVKILCKLPSQVCSTYEGMEFTFTKNEKAFFEIADWIFWESKCCPWAVFSLKITTSEDNSRVYILSLISNSEEGLRFFKANLDFLKTIPDEVPENSKSVEGWQKITKNNCCN